MDSTWTQLVEVFLVALEKECRKNEVAFIDFSIELVSKTSLNKWYFVKSKMVHNPAPAVEKKLTTRLTLSIQESAIPKLLKQEISFFRAYITGSVKYSGNIGLLKKHQSQLLFPIMEVLKLAKRKKVLTTKQIELACERLNISPEDLSDMSGVSSEALKVDLFESERFLSAFRKRQETPLFAKSIIPETNFLVRMTHTLYQKVKSISKESKSKSLFSSVATVFVSILSKSWTLLPLTLCWQQVLSANRPTNFSTNMATLVLVMGLRQPHLLLLSSVAANVGVRSALQYLFTFSQEKVLSSVFFLGIFAARLLLSRQIKIYVSALFVIFSYFFVMIFFSRLLKWSDNRVDKIYVRMHHFYAPYCCDRVLQLRSVFVKFGQYLGGRADIVPIEWNKILEKLQDDMPPDREQYVKKIVESEFNMRIEDIFYEFNYKPLASASVAQVHEAYLRKSDGSKGRRVALKIQHEGIANLIQSDMVAFKRLVKLIGYLNAKFKPTYGMLCAWEKEIILELDFRIEASNISMVRNNFKEIGMLDKNSENLVTPDSIPEDASKRSRVLMPQLISGFVQKRVFLMTFLEGFKMNDLQLLELYNINPAELMERIVQVYGAQLFVSGVFNADPHAGNILINIDSSGELRPVLLDFGMVIKLTRREKIGYCKLLFALSQLSVTAFSEALKLIGYANSQSHIYPERDLEFFAYLLRPTASRDQSITVSKNFMRHRKKQRKNDLSGSSDDIEESIREGRYFKEFPEKLMFLFRVLGLIRGLCSLMEVRVDYIKVFCSYARYSLLQMSDDISFREMTVPSLRATRTTAAPSVSSNISNRRFKVVKKFEGLSEQFEKMFQEHANQLIGVQVSCVYRGIQVASISKGEYGPSSCRKVSSSTLFPLQDISSIVTSLAILKLLSDGEVKLNSKISSLLGMTELDFTVQELLCFSAKLPDVFPFGTAAQLVEANMKEAFHGVSLEKKSSFASPTIHTHVFLMQLVVENVSGISLQQFLETRLLNVVDCEEVVLNYLQEDCAQVSNQIASLVWDAISRMLFSAGATKKDGDDTDGLGSILNRDFRGIFIDPLMVNSQRLEEKFLSSVGVYGTAFGVNQLFRRAFKKLISKPVLAKIFSIDTLKEDSALFGTRNWSLGFQLEMIGRSMPILFKQGCGGSLFLVCPSIGLYVTILLNNYTLSRDFNRNVLKAIFQRLDLKVNLEDVFRGIEF